MFLVFVGKPKGVLHSTAGYMLYVATTFKYTFDHQAGGGGSSNTHSSIILFMLLVNADALVNANPSLAVCPFVPINQCCGFALVSMRMRIRIQLLTSMLIRIQGAKPVLIRILVRLLGNRKLNF
jgi:hypothetical protein